MMRSLTISFLILYLTSIQVFAQKIQAFAFSPAFIQAEHGTEIPVYSGIQAALQAEGAEALSLNIDDPRLGEIASLNRLKFLYLDKSFNASNLKREGIDNFLAALGQLENLHYISLHHYSILHGLKNIKGLKGLKLEESDETENRNMNDYLPLFPTLELLVIKDSKIKTLPSVLCKLDKLKQLEVYSYSLTVLPDSIGNLQKLEVLKLQCGSMLALPGSLAGLKNLRYLKIGGLCMFRKFPMEICQLGNLEELNMEVKIIEFIPMELLNLKKLRLLSFHEVKNLQKAVPPLSQLPLLEHIFLSDAPAFISWADLKNINHPFSITLNRSAYEKFAEGLKDNPNLKSITVPSTTLPPILKKMKTQLTESRVRTKEM